VHRFTVFASLFLLLLGRSADAEVPRIAASVKPVHALAAAVTGDLGTPDLLLDDGNASPHATALRPSAARALAGADLVIWIGPGLETFLIKPIKNLAPVTRVMTLSDNDALTLLGWREGDDWAHHDHDHGGHGHEDHAEEHHDDGHQEHGNHDHEEHGHKDGHGHDGIDPHVWLDPENGMAILSEIADALAEIDPANAAVYHANAAAEIERLTALTNRIDAMLAPVRAKPYLVFHDAYHYFEHRFGLSSRGAIAVSPEQTPGASHVREIHHQVTEDGIVCVFTEPQFRPSLVRTVIEGTQARSATLDPIGADLPAGPDMYRDLLLRNAESLVGCLSGEDP